MPFEQTGPEGKEVTTASGLQYIDSQNGHRSHGTSWPNGERALQRLAGQWDALHDSSLERGQPFPFPLGAGRVIKGWDEGVQGMHCQRQTKTDHPLPFRDGGLVEPGMWIPPHATLHL